MALQICFAEDLLERHSGLAFGSRLSYLASGIVHLPSICSPSIWQTCDLASRHSLDTLWHPISWDLDTCTIYALMCVCVCAWVCVIDSAIEVAWSQYVSMPPLTLSKALPVLLWAGNWYVWCFRKSSGTARRSRRLWKNLLRPQQEP